MEKKVLKSKLRLFTFLAISWGVFSCLPKKDVGFEEKLSQQFSYLLNKTNEEYDLEIQRGSQRFFPRSLTQSGDIAFVSSGDWCSGFFPGGLWLMAELTGDANWQGAAKKYTALLEQEQWNNGTHDMGFKIMSSYGQGYKQTGSQKYADIMVQSAKTLITRFNPTVGCIRSWDHNAERWTFPVIIDNMMNLELLFKATQLTGDSTFYHIAVMHANTTLKNHFRADGSSIHVVDYNPETGEINEKVTHQGDTDDSSWSRGQAWGLYGYTMCYRFTHDRQYLNQAVTIAGYLMNHPNLPSDHIPMWDFNYSENSGEPRDVSAASIMASALIELADYSDSSRAKYLQWADEVIETLKTDYLVPAGQRNGYLLDHSVSFRHENHEVDVPLIYADYYFLEALIRQNCLKRNQRVVY